MSDGAKSATAGLVDPGPIEFEAVIQDDDGGRYGWVDFPYDLKETYGKGNLVPIVATFDGDATYQGSLARMGGEHPMLLLRSDVRSQIDKPSGAPIHVRVELDTKPRVIELADDAAAALKAHPAAAAHWQELSYSHQRDYHLWIEEAKKPETRARRIDKMVTMLSDGETLK